MFRIFTFVVAFLTAGGWLLSWVHRLDWLGWLAPLGMLLAVWVVCRRWERVRELWRELKAPLTYRPFLLVALFIVAAGALYSPGMLDSLTYRLPRMLLWLRENRIAFIGSAEPRLDYPSQVWELCNLPVVVTLGCRWVWLTNFVCWIICYLAFGTWARQFGLAVSSANRLAVMASASTFGVLQACSTANDLLAVALILLALVFIVDYERDRRAVWINWAGLSVCLAAGVKAHFAVLALPFVLWFWLARSRPWRAYDWRWLPVMLPLLLVCSPLPAFVQNHLHYGQITGPAGDRSFVGAGPLSNMVIGSLMMAWQLFQPRINPLALVLKEPLAKWVADSGITQYAPRFDLSLTPVQMVDNASIGFVTTALVVVGVFLVLRRSRAVLKTWPGWAALAGLGGFLLAVSQFLPSTVGRSSAGFVFLLFPLAMLGWMKMSERATRGWLWISVGASLFAVAMNPVRPLWPAQACAGWLQRAGWANAEKAFAPYLTVAERAQSGRSLAELVPEDEPGFVALIGAEDPLLPVLADDDNIDKAILLPLHAQVQELEAAQVRYVLVSGMASLSYPEICAHLENGDEYQLVQSAEYTSKLARGPQTWKLFCRVERKPRALR